MKLQIPEPSFKSPLLDLIIELEQIRNRAVGGSTPPWLFFELKGLFHIVESLASARIEGNHTTLAELADAQSQDRTQDPDERFQEILNIEKSLDFIEKNISSNEIDKQFIYELHTIVVKGLTKEGDSRAGAWRTKPVNISKSKHTPPQPADIADLMEELIAFINSKPEQKTDLLRMAVAHHRFAWIHPFGNGNGRVVRLLTYAMLTKQGFIDTYGSRLLNPTAIFCMDRNMYYEMLEKADTGSEEGILAWSEYVLKGLSVETKKALRLLDYKTTRETILTPMLKWALGRNIITIQEKRLLEVFVNSENGVAQAGNMRHLFPIDVSHVIISKALRKLRENKLIEPLDPNTRKYVLKLTGNQLTRGVLERLDKQGFLPLKLDE